MTAELVAEAPAAGMYDIAEADYFAATWALSCSGAKLLLPPSCPAKFFYRQDHQERKAVWDFGSGAHNLVLGTGPEIIEVKFDDWKKQAARDQQAAAREAGKIPLLTKELAIVKEMARAIEAKPAAWNLLDPRHGRAEQSLFWQDPQSGQWLRSRLDWIYEREDGSAIVVDYKTCTSAHPDLFAKDMANFRYDMQDAFYSDGAAVVFGRPVDFVFIAQEKTPPYLVNVVQLTNEDRAGGRMLNRQAIDIYRTCIATAEWPGYSDEIDLISLPAWARRREDY